MVVIYFIIIAFGALLIWFSGKKLVQNVDFICEQTGLGRAFLGALLLGIVTSLPEISTTMIAAFFGNAELAASNLIGGVSMQTSMLAVADAFIVNKALTFIAPNPALLMGGVLLVIQISYVITCVAVGEIFQLFQIGLFSFGSFALYVVCLRTLRKYEKTKRWVPADYPDIAEKEENNGAPFAKRYNSLKSAYIHIICYSLLVFIGGSAVSYSAHQITELTLLSSSLLGATLVAFSTSLPELSTTLAAVRMGSYTLAISNILGSNLLMVGLVFFADIFYTDGLLLDHVGSSTLYLGSLGILVTAIYLWGLLERNNRTIFNMGIDSFLVLTIHITGLVIMYTWL